MSEILSRKLSPENKRDESEGIVTPFGSVARDETGLFYAVTMSGESSVPVPESIAEMMSLGLRAQEKVTTGKYPHLQKQLELLNCRKSLFVASGQMDIKEAVHPEEDINGIELLLSDVERLQQEGYKPFEIRQSYKDEITTYLDEYEGTFPAVVHMFEIEKGTVGEELVSDLIDFGEDFPSSFVAKLHRVHSFVVLGEDDNGYVLFQKEGPQISQPFMVANLEHFSYQLDPDRKGLVFAGPMAKMA